MEHHAQTVSDTSLTPKAKLEQPQKQPQKQPQEQPQEQPQSKKQPQIPKNPKKFQNFKIPPFPLFVNNPLSETPCEQTLVGRPLIFKMKVG